MDQVNLAAVLGSYVVRQYHTKVSQRREVIETIGPAMTRPLASLLGLLLALAAATPAVAQLPPSAAERARYTGLLAAADRGDAAGIRALAARGINPHGHAAHGRTPLHVAAYGRSHEATRAPGSTGAASHAPA